MKINTEEGFLGRLEGYPSESVTQMTKLRTLVHEVVKEHDLLPLTETLKWNEPSFITKHGSTLRMDWKKKNRTQYAFYFSCSTSLVDTFKLVFGESFQYEGKRAIVFNLGDSIPEEELKACIKTCLTYHKVKHLPLLGL